MPGIHFVREQAYRAGIRPIHESSDCVTHLAQLQHPEHGVGNYYVKHYLGGAIPTKGLVNEACGHILASAAGLPLPGGSLVVEVPAERISDMHPSHANTVSRGQVLTWATPDTGGRPLPKSGDEVEGLLRSWKSVGALIAFDSWVVIPDRSPENLVSRGKKDIMVIDHGHLGGSVRWAVDNLLVDDDRRHPLLTRLWVDRLPEEINQRIVVAAERHAECLSRTESELIRWADALAGVQQDRMALLDFLRRRAEDGPDRMRRMLSLLA